MKGAAAAALHYNKRAFAAVFLAAASEKTCRKTCLGSLMNKTGHGRALRGCCAAAIALANDARHDVVARSRLPALPFFMHKRRRSAPPFFFAARRAPQANECFIIYHYHRRR